MIVSFGVSAFVMATLLVIAFGWFGLMLAAMMSGALAALMEPIDVIQLSP